MPAGLKGGRVGIAASGTLPVRLPCFGLHFFQCYRCSLPVAILQYPEFRPGINRGQFPDGTRRILIAQGTLDTLSLQFTASLGYHKQGGMGVDESHSSCGSQDMEMRASRTPPV